MTEPTHLALEGATVPAEVAPPLLPGPQIQPQPPPNRRRLAARGVAINSVFQVGLGGLNLLRTLFAAAFLTRTEFGVWSILFLSIALVVAVKAAAVGDKYIQQDDEDQVLAFQRSFTLEVISSLLMFGLAIALAPLVALIYGESRLLLPMMALGLMLPGLALQAPIWIYYRRMDFLRQRIFMAVDPLVAFTLTVGLAAAGLGYWALVIGSVGGALTGGLVAIWNCPYPLRWRFDRATLRSYLSFSVPLMVAVVSGLMIAQLSVLFANLALGLAAVGAIGLAASVTAWTDRADAVITQAMYPAICRVADRKDLLLEAFVKSNRLALIWAVPFGVGVSLFAADVISHTLGPGWKEATILFQVFGAQAALNHIGFNWTAFYRAVGRTRPMAVVTVAALICFLTVATPLLFAFGLEGFAFGIAAMTLVALLGRVYYVRRLMPELRIWRHIWRAIAPVIPATAAILLIRTTGEGPRTDLVIGAEAVFFAITTLIGTMLLERTLLREALSYLRAGKGTLPAGEAA